MASSRSCSCMMRAIRASPLTTSYWSSPPSRHTVARYSTACQSDHTFRPLLHGSRVLANAGLRVGCVRFHQPGSENWKCWGEPADFRFFWFCISPARLNSASNQPYSRAFSKKPRSLRTCDIAKPLIKHRKFRNYLATTYEANENTGCWSEDMLFRI